MRRRRRGPPPRRRQGPWDRLSEWLPKTKLGKRVLRGEITTMGQALRSGLPLREHEIVDFLLPELDDEVLDVNMVQRMTDSGRRIGFVITVVVGNNDGYVGVGRLRGREVGPAIRKTIDHAKLNMVEVKRGCGSWECGCFTPHTLPFKVVGRSGSVELTLKPAPQGVGLALAGVARSVVRLSGIKDAWGFARGHTKTTVNYAFAAADALRQTMEYKVSPEQAARLHILSGPVAPFEINLAELQAKEAAAAAAALAEPESEAEGVTAESEASAAKPAEAPKDEGGKAK
ncbi:MAG: 30S ribosomal protein S5 [Thermoplasmata archaeon]